MCCIIHLPGWREHQYIALVPLNEDEDSEEGDVYLYRFQEFEDGEFSWTTSLMMKNMRLLPMLLMNF